MLVRVLVDGFGEQGKGWWRDWGSARVRRHVRGRVTAVC